MIFPINQINHKEYLYSKYAVSGKKDKKQFSDFELSGYQTGQAIAAKNGISFKKQENLISLNSIYDKKLNSENVKFYYTYDSNKKNDTLAYYSGMLFLFYSPAILKNIDKKTINGKSYLLLDINAGENNINTYGDCYKKQQGALQILHNTSFQKTLDSMKEYDIELQNEYYQNGEIDTQTKNENIEIINSISAQDVKDFIKNNMLGKNPMIIK